MITDPSMEAQLFQHLQIILKTAWYISIAMVFILLAKSVKDISRAGPDIRGEILGHYLGYSAYGILRLSFWAWLILFLMCLGGGIANILSFYLLDIEPGYLSASLFALASVCILTALAALSKLLYSPSTLAMSSHYRMSHLYPVWELLTPARIALLRRIVLGGLLALTLAAFMKYLIHARNGSTALTFIIAILAGGGIFCGFFGRAMPKPAAEPIRKGGYARDEGPVNIVMIGSDTLRADRLGIEGYPRSLTPTLDSLANRGAYFGAQFVPVARTAPSLVALMTGKWPQRTGIRDNFVSEAEARLGVPSLASVLKEAGYATAAIGDWSGGDYGKFDFGFEYLDVPEDQWNIKYLMRQGPKDLRLFLSLFTNNALGKRILPEIYYLAGIPLVDNIVSSAKSFLDRATQDARPFFVNVFMGATHPPFGSAYPYYTLYANANYKGESKFCMSRLTDPMEIIRSQQEPREAFDLDQVIDLYDGSVRYFDDAVRDILGHLEALGIDDRTMIVIYSDHGMELFENDTWGQGNSVFSDYSARIPLIIHHPRRPAVGKIDQVTRSIDLAPTLLELAGIDHPAIGDGVSLVPCMDDPSLDLGLYAYTESGIWLTRPPGMPADHLMYPMLLEMLDVPDKASGALAIQQAYKDIVVVAKDRMLRNDDWKLIYVPLVSGGRFFLFDMKNDPHCRKDVSQDYPNIVTELRKILAQHLSVDGISAN
jgi:arylsulfatase A-like enzyme